jgi:hypothetical protein
LNHPNADKVIASKVPELLICVQAIAGCSRDYQVRFSGLLVAAFKGQSGYRFA